MILDFVFYSLYRFVRITPSKDEQPHYIANISFSILVTFNIIFLISFLDKKGVINYGYSDLEKSYIVICLAVFILAYLLFIYKYRYKHIIKKYDSHSFRRRLIYHILTFLWIISTVILVINKA